MVSYKKIINCILKIFKLRDRTLNFSKETIFSTSKDE